MPGGNNTLNQVGYEQPTVGNDPVSLTRPTNERPRHALIGVSGGAIRWLATPTDTPSAARGNYVGAGGIINWTDPNLDFAGMIDNVKFVKAGAVDATLEVSYFA